MNDRSPIYSKPVFFGFTTCLRLSIAFAIAASAPLSSARAQTIPVAAPLSLALSMDAANEAIQVCNAKGYKVAVTVVDTDGVVKVQARGDGSPIHSQRFSFRKAYTIVSMGPMFGVDSSSAVIKFLNSKNPVGNRQCRRRLDRPLFLPGGVLIKAGKETVGSIGVSGAPFSTEDEACAQAGVARIQGRLDRGAN